MRALFRIWLRRQALLPRPLRIALAGVLVAGTLVSVAAQSSQAQSGSAAQALVQQGRALYVDSCSSCHGFRANGIPGSGPNLHGAGAGAADWYLSTGRMPLQNPRDEPERGRPHFTRPEINALVAYVGSLGGPPIPTVDPSKGSLSEGLELFTEKCAGCHQILGRGGTATGARIPDLQKVSATDIAEVVRFGPYVMPRFSEKDIDQEELNSLSRYILYTQHPADKGGWGIGHIGPIPEGMVAWLLAGSALVLVARLIGERTVE
jgi:ubiquinol-cytochrome c reductase cytochrome c subunit